MPPNATERQYIEEVALYFEGQGLPRMAGRVLGWLLICDPAVQSSQDLADALDASKGSVSTSTRMLMQLGLVQRVAMPGERGMHFTITSDSWSRLLGTKLILLTQFRGLAERGVAMLADGPVARRSRLEEIRDFYSFLESEFPALLARWAAHREGR